MPIEIRGPDGSINKFPDGMSDEAITAVMRREYGGPGQPGRIWSAPAPSSPSPEKPRERATFLPLAEDETGKIGLGVPGLIYHPYKAFERAWGNLSAGARPEDVAGDAFTAASAAVPGAGRAMATREAITNAAKAEAAGTAAFGPRIGPTGLEQSSSGIGGKWFDDTGQLNPRIPVSEKPAAKDRREIIQDATDLGVQLPAAAVGKPMTQATAGGLSSTPLGMPIVNASRKATEQLGESVAGVSEQMGSGSRVAAGEAMRDDILNWIDNVRAANNRQAYAKVDALINPDFKGDIPKTRAAAGELKARDIASATPDGQKVIAYVQDALKKGGKDGFTYEGLKELRTRVGERVNGTIAPEQGVSAKAFDSLYAALTDDLRFLVGRAGAAKGSSKQATAAFDEATTVAREGFERRASMAKIVGSKGADSAEAIVDRIQAMASAKGGADISRLRQAKSSVGDAAWNEVGSALLRRMGQTKDGFSIARWRTEYEKLSEEGKAALYGKGPGSHRETLDKIARVGQTAEQLMRWGNPSGTARGAMTTGALVGMFTHPYAVLGAALGDYALSVMLARPVSAKAASHWMETYVNWMAEQSPARTRALQQSTRVLAADVSQWADGKTKEKADRLNARFAQGDAQRSQRTRRSLGEITSPLGEAAALP